jgi:hypothetical protein
MSVVDLAKATRALQRGHVVQANGCWEWQRSKMNSGYGRIYTGFGRDMSAHRAAYIAWNGDIPEGKVVMHTCDNRVCINPDHLILGTKADNSRDMVAKGRNKSPGWQKTACPRGHPYDRININGARYCSICHREALRAFRERKQA